MAMRCPWIQPAIVLSLVFVLTATTWAQASDSQENKTGDNASAKPAPRSPDHATILKDAQTIPGLITLHQKGNKLYGELSSGDYNNEYIVLISIARGIGRGSLLGGMSWGFGDDWVWAFRKIDDRVHIIRRNVRFRADKNSPEASAVKNAYTDSVLFSLPVITKGPRGGDLVDLTPVFMSDLPQISNVLPGFIFAADKSTWASVKGFKDNIELQVSATYASGGSMRIDSVPDTRGVTINVHYSISKVPQTGYQPRLADNRVGYFVTAVKDYSKRSDREQFVRYINRWHLEKADPSAKLSPPKQPIIFWIEKTVPFQYRRPIREGIEEWNKAFEQAGFVNAIEVRQQPDDADWDPEDVNYNTFRWITSSAGFAMGPSRVNPYTGQILDADIIFDADFLQFWKAEYETLTPESIAALTGGSLDPESYQQQAAPHDLFGLHSHHQCTLSHGMSRQFAFGAAALIARNPKQAAEMQEKMIMQGLKEVTMHEVGHTLGLRHNFKGSSHLSLDDLNDPEKVRKSGMVASVMDYNPTNIVPEGQEQGYFFTPTIGPYDIWAIQYGYTPLSGGTDGELKELQKIAARSGEPGLAYATDEDTRGIDPDPYANRFDLGDDVVKYAKQRAQLVQELMPDLIERITQDGDDYSQARRAFNVLLSQHGQGMFFSARYIGGLHTSRSHRGDENARPPISQVDPQKQRDALEFLENQLFCDQPFQFSPELYNYLAASNWRHWGVSPALRKDFPVHSVIAMWQQRILDQLLGTVTLERIHDTELKIPPDEDAFTAAELIERLTKSIFSEVDLIEDGQYTNRSPAISSLRRNLQRNYLRQMSNLAMGRTSAPQDCQTVAFAELSSLEGRINQLLNGDVQLDSYTRAHLQESASRIQKVVDARLVLSGP